MSTILASNTSKDIYSSDFENFIRSLKNPSQFIMELRREAANSFASLDFPTTRHEDWKYTNIAPVIKQQFNSGLIEQLPSINSYLLAGTDCYTLVFVNGIFVEKLSQLNDSGIIIQNIDDAQLQYPQIFNKYFAKSVTLDQDVFTAWNTAFYRDGAFILVPSGKIIEKPVQIVYINDSAPGHMVSFPRNLIVAGANSSVKIFESYHSTAPENFSLVNGVTEIFVEDNASVDYYKLQQQDDRTYHIDNTRAIQESNSNFSSCAIVFGGSIVRNNLNIRLNGQGCEGHMLGLSVLAGKQHADNHTSIDHAYPHCYSNELYKTIIDENAHGVFSGKIMVRKDAQKTNAFQSSKNVLLSESARVDVKPQLEIFADDVKCSHGATTGRLNPEAMFYMQSRGIGIEKARALLVFAFANEIFQSVKIPALKENLEKLLSRKLKTDHLV